MNLALVPLAAAGANPLALDIWTFLWQALNVLIVMAVLYKMLFKPLGGLMERRTQAVEEALANAKAQREEAERMFADYQEQIKNAQAEAREIVGKATREAEEYSRRRRDEVEAEAERMLERAKTEIESERQKALASIRDEVTTLTIAVAERVIGRELNSDDHSRLVREMLTEVESRDLKAGEPH